MSAKKQLIIIFTAISFFLQTLPAQTDSHRTDTNLSPQNTEYKINAVTEPKTLLFKYKNEDRHRILSTVLEDVYYNGQLHHQAEILNRITVEISDVTQTDALHKGTFMTSEKSVTNQQTFTYGQNYPSEFRRDQYGYYTITDEYFMPVVRDVPILPKAPVVSGYVWKADGHEAHDLRETFKINKPYKVPFTATYEYLGTIDRDGRTLDVIKCDYVMKFNVSKEINTRTLTEVPANMTGYSDQLIFWDNERGQIENYKESFEIQIVTNKGNILTFTGIAHAQVNEFHRTATEENVKDLSEKIENLGLSDVNVIQSEKGLTLSIENIQFQPDSDILMYEEKNKLTKIASLLQNYPDNDILVTGHTALRGDEKSRNVLSKARAEAVADFLIKLKVRDKYHIFTEGKGATQPVAPNTTEAGRKKNRRVEITILDK